MRQLKQFFRFRRPQKWRIAASRVCRQQAGLCFQQGNLTALTPLVFPAALQINKRVKPFRQFACKGEVLCARRCIDEKKPLPITVPACLCKNLIVVDTADEIARQRQFTQKHFQPPHKARLLGGELHQRQRLRRNWFRAVLQWQRRCVADCDNAPACLREFIQLCPHGIIKRIAMGQKNDLEAAVWRQQFPIRRDNALQHDIFKEKLEIEMRANQRIQGCEHCLRAVPFRRKRRSLLADGGVRRYIREGEARGKGAEHGDGCLCASSAIEMVHSLHIGGHLPIVPPVGLACVKRTEVLTHIRHVVGPGGVHHADAHDIQEIIRALLRGERRPFISKRAEARGFANRVRRARIACRGGWELGGIDQIAWPAARFRAHSRRLRIVVLAVEEIRAWKLEMTLQIEGVPSRRRHQPLA